MRRFSCAALAAVAVVGLGSVASAADMPMKAAPMVSRGAAYNWAGWYLGGNIGYGWGGNTNPALSFTDPTGFGLAPLYAAGGNVTPNLSPKGGLGGGQIGYNWNLAPQWVVGFVADLQASNVSASGSNTVAPPPFLTSIQSASIKTDWFGTVRGKVGYAMDNWLLYGTGGFAYGHVKTSASTFFPLFAATPGQLAGTSSKTLTGWSAGAGIDFAFARNWTIGAEYLYVDLGHISTTQQTSLPFFAPVLTVTTNQKVSMQVGRLTINYKF